MARSRVLIFGSGYLGRQITHHLLAYYEDSVELLGFADDTRDAGEEVIHGLKTLGSLATVRAQEQFDPEETQAVFAIGYADMLARRAALDRLIDAGYGLFSVIHPEATVEPGAEIGAGSVVLGGAVIDQGVKVGPACFVDIGVRLGAETVCGSNNYFSSGTSTGSRVVIGDDCFFGMTCTITTDVQMGSNLFVNAMTLVARDVGDNLKLVELHKSKELPRPTR